MAGDVPDDPAVVALLAALARVQMQIVSPDAIDTVDRALGPAERLRLTQIIADAIVTKAAIIDTLGRPLEGTALVRGGIDLAVEHGWIDIELRGRSNLSSTLFSDRPVEATEIATAARELAVG